MLITCEMNHVRVGDEEENVQIYKWKENPKG